MNNFIIQQKRCNNGTDNSLLSIMLNQQCLTSHFSSLESDKKIKSELVVDVQVMARWFAENWWRLRWEVEKEGLSALQQLDWEMSHRLTAAGHGYIWPDITFISDNNTILVDVKSNSLSEPISFSYPTQQQWLGAKQFEQGIEAFVEQTVQNHVSNTELAELWEIVKEERSNPDVSLWRKLEAKAGFDPDDAPDELIQTFVSFSQEYGEHCISEFVDEKLQNADTSLSELISSLKQSSYRLDSSAVSTVRIERPSGLNKPWQYAEAVAQKVRQILGNISAPITNKQLTEFVGVSENILSTIADTPYTAGLRLENETHFTLSGRRETGKRFSLARLLGDVFYSQHLPQERLFIATNSHSERQRFQRAFAQSLLCPAESLFEWLGTKRPNDEACEKAAEHFNVSPLTIKYLLENKALCL